MELIFADIAQLPKHSIPFSTASAKLAVRHTDLECKHATPVLITLNSKPGHFGHLYYYPLRRQRVHLDLSYIGYHNLMRSKSTHAKS